MTIAKYLEIINNSPAAKGLVDQAREWLSEGWSVTDEPTPAVIFNEAKTQDECVKKGESNPAFPKLLRRVAYDILRHDDHNQENR